MELTPQERQILASIEQQVRKEDPHLASVFNDTAMLPITVDRLPVPARHVSFLVGALVGLALLAPIVVRFGWVALAALTITVIVPWVVSTARASSQSLRHRVTEVRRVPEPRRTERRDGDADGDTGPEPACL